MNIYPDKDARPRMRDIPALTGLRFVAASYVVLFHAWPVFMPHRPGPQYWNQFISLGYVAVSLFFVLSGFILVTVYLAGQSSGTIDRNAFWQARFARIYPAYAASLLVSAPFALAYAGNHSAIYHACKAFLLTISNGGLVQAWHPALSGNWNRPTWSVSVEAFFYLLFPVVGSWAIRAKYHPLVLAAAFWLLSIASSLMCIHFLPSLSHSMPRLEILLFNPLLRLPEFMVGICLGIWAARGNPLGVRHATGLAIATYLLLVPVLTRLPFLLVSNGLLAPLFGTVIVALGTSSELYARLLGNPIMVRLGHASFSLYLFHFPILFWMTFLARHGDLKEKLVGPWPANAESPAYLVFYFCSCIGLSLLSYSYLESPARKILKRWMSRRKQKAFAGAYNTATPELSRLTTP
jgi:peptidoglycan/LPS O-acetylase OafA/YrhL